VLWDKKTNQMVNNESLEILRNLNTGFDMLDRFNWIPWGSGYRCKDGTFPFSGGN
jgi:glutathionyl-hydroquinone reductase